MNILKFTIAGLVIGLLSSIAQAASVATIYISATGSDNNSGASPQDPVQTPKRVLEILSNNYQSAKVIIMPGHYYLKSPFIIQGVIPTIWTSYSPGEAIFDGENKSQIGIYIKGSNITLTGVKICCTIRDGIRIEASHDINIIGNTINDIVGDGQSQGAIHGIQTAYNVIVKNNEIYNTGYAGILFDSSETGNISNVVIDNNTVTRSCQIIRDCGAIYSMGHSKNSFGFHVKNNIVKDFGPIGNATKGIYLDDGLSGALVEGNKISGNGSFGLQIHGGKGNIIRNNLFDVSNNRSLALIQNVKKYETDMKNNRFFNNKILGTPREKAMFQWIGVNSSALSMGSR